MNNNLFALTVGSLLVAGFAGCESARTTPSDTAPRGEIRALEPPPPAATTENQILSAAAAQTPAPVEGEGWRMLFDGKSLAGWRATDFGSGGSVEVQKGLLVFWIRGRQLHQRNPQGELRGHV
jgi:hypothetical protein